MTTIMVVITPKQVKYKVSDKNYLGKKVKTGYYKIQSIIHGTKFTND